MAKCTSVAEQRSWFLLLLAFLTVQVAVVQTPGEFKIIHNKIVTSNASQLTREGAHKKSVKHAREDKKKNVNVLT